MGHYIFVEGVNGVIARYSAAAGPSSGTVIISEEEARRRQPEIEAAHHLAIARQQAETMSLLIGAVGSLVSDRSISAAESTLIGDGSFCKN